MHTANNTVNGKGMKNYKYLDIPVDDKVLRIETGKSITYSNKWNVR